MKNILPAVDEFAGKLIDSWLLENEIGRGNIGVVYLAHHRDIRDMPAACKIITINSLKTGWQIELEKVGKLTGIDQVAQYRSHNSVIIDGNSYEYIIWEGSFSL